jgi:hypothetical protein
MVEKMVKSRSSSCLILSLALLNTDRPVRLNGEHAASCDRVQAGTGLLFWIVAMRLRYTAQTALMTALLFMAVPVAAEDVLLTLTGAVTDGRVEMTRADFDTMDWHEFSTSTSVTDGRPEFRGVLMRDILAHAEAEGSSVRATALNDYVVDIPVEDFHRFDVLAALYMDGVPLTPRDKGPVWIVYPRDNHGVLADIRYDMRWVWQLVALHVQ